MRIYQQSSGHLYGWKKGKKVYVHREVMEAHLGRKLRRDEVVHHRNEDPSDNRIENLEVMSNAKHTSIHFKRLHVGTYVCVKCGKKFERLERAERRRVALGRSGPFCGKSCSAKALMPTVWSKGRRARERAPCGTNSAYGSGCRCARCRAAHAAVARKTRSRA